MTGMKQSEEGNELILRFFEVYGKETAVNLKLPVSVKAARRLNILEQPLPNTDKPVVTGNSIQVRIKPHEIVTLGLTTAQ
jgi:alpha-mannosidase